MQLMLLNATMPQKSTERYKLSLPVTTIGMIQICLELLEERRMVKHTYSDALSVAIESVVKTVPTQVKMLCRFYYVPDESTDTIKVRKETKQNIYQLAKKHKVTAAAFIDSVMTIFFRAMMATIWKNSQHRYAELHSRYSSIIQSRKTAVLNVKRIKEPSLTKRKLKQQKDEIEMRHHNYMAEFRSYMEKFGGIDSWLNKNVLLMIHSKPLAGSVGKATDLDVPKESNPGTVHNVRIWKRGRGYNITVLSHHASYGSDAPQLEPGSVFRLYDIYRNIDWLTIKTTN